MAVSSWYSSLNAKFLDLIGDFAGKEKFFIEGDSLLLECFSNPQLDFDPAFQLLHATWLVEKYLSDLAKRGGNFDLIFFDHHAKFCVPSTAKDSSKYLLARTAIIKHLQHNAQDIETKNFPGLGNKLFTDYLKHSGCLFALCSDGASYSYSKDNKLRLKDHTTSDKTDVSYDSRAGLRHTIFELAQKKLDIALLNGLTCQDSKIFAFVLERKLVGKPSSSMQAIFENVLSTFEITDESTKQPCSLFPTAGSLVPASSLRLKMIIGALAHDALANAESQHKFSTLLHAVYLEIMPLAARHYGAVKFPSEDEDRLQCFISQLSQILRAALSTRNDTTDATVADLIDGRLLRLILANPARAWEDLPTDCFNAVRHLATHFGIVLPSPVDATQQHGAITVQPDAASSEAGDITRSTILPFSHPAFDPHLTSISVQENADKKVYDGKLALELTHWHNSKKALGAKVTRPRDPKADSRMLKRQQRAYAQLTGYAMSLTGGSFDPKLIVAEKASTSKDAKIAVGLKKAPKLSSKAKDIIKVNQEKLTAKNALKAKKAKPFEAAELLPMHKSVIDRLQYDGPLLERGHDAQSDARVPFKPDPWQVEVLDELDSGNSVLLVAPTSSGKTFVSFYAMEKVLRASDNDVLVYVAPTKALVNQIAAEVMGRYKKTYDTRSVSKSVVSIYTRDIRVNDPMRSQILVTVPAMLQILLMSPSNKSWVPRIKTVIFDEVHSISQAADGLVWEQLIMSSPCQLIALSATIGNVSAFSKWLSSTQSGTGKELKLIEHGQRWSDLRKYVYSPSVKALAGQGELQLPKKPESAPLGLEQLDDMKHVHPVAALLHQQRGMPPDLTLESNDCLMLWQSMTANQTPSYKVPTSLDPASYFASGDMVKADVVRWGRELKDILGAWMQDSESPFPNVRKALSKNLDHTFEGSFGDTLKTTMPLLRDLRSQGALPAILFNYNRKECEDIALHLLEHLEKDEATFKNSSASWASRLEKFELWKSGEKARQKEVARADKEVENERKRNAKKSKKNREDRDELTTKTERNRVKLADQEDLAMLNFDPAAPLDDFSFADVRKSDPELFAASIRHFERVGIPEPLIRAFHRGIGVHHSGMNKYYRQAVEMFFRRGYLTVVVATGTLSLGINMPTKTVVFAGDSVFLTALNYRQSSGRAGRRGWDLLGCVVFQNISTDKALRLMSSKLPDINGHFPMTTVFVLRLLALLHGTNNAKYAMDMVDTLLSRAQLYQQGGEFKHQIQHHVRFSIEYLRSQGMLNAQGQPINFASLVSHLYYTEKGALAFHALLKEGYFSQLARKYRETEEKVGILRKLMLVLSHLFGRRAMRPAEKEDEQERIKKSVSTVFLKPLPSEATAILDAHNQQTLDVYVDYVATYIDQHCHDPDTTLPLSKVQIKPTTTTNNLPSGNVSLQGQLPSTTLRSPFAALSGHGDTFSTISDLCAGARDGVFLEKAVIPHLDLGSRNNGPNDSATATTALNAYLYDFFVHGSVKALVDANRISRGDVWFLLNDFATVLATVVTALENFIAAGGGGDGGVLEEGEFAAAAADNDEDDDMSEGSAATRARNPVDGEEGGEVDVEDDDDDEWDPDGVAQSRVEQEMRGVLDMFTALKEAFDVQFKRMWA